MGKLNKGFMWTAMLARLVCDILTLNRSFWLAFGNASSSCIPYRPEAFCVNECKLLNSEVKWFQSRSCGATFQGEFTQLLFSESFSVGERDCLTSGLQLDHFQHFRRAVSASTTLHHFCRSVLSVHGLHKKGICVQHLCKHPIICNSHC